MIIQPHSTLAIPYALPSEGAFQSIHNALGKCLAETYRLEKSASQQILEILSSADQNLLEDFLSLSKQIKLSFDTQPAPLSEWDATIQAPASHRILFENNQLRILESRLQPGETAPFHTHQWDQVMIILKGSKFRIEDQTGNSRVEEWQPLVGTFKGDVITSSTPQESYTHIGSQEFLAIAFELKR